MLLTFACQGKVAVSCHTRSLNKYYWQKHGLYMRPAPAYSVYPSVMLHILGPASLDLVADLYGVLDAAAFTNKPHLVTLTDKPTLSH